MLQIIFQYLGFFLIAASLGCSSNQTVFSGIVNQEKWMAELPIVSVKTDIEEHAVEQVRLIGRYTQIDVRQRRESPPVYQGHVALTLEDDTQVLLYPIWHVEAQRPEGEIDQYENQQVIVIGTIFPQAPSNPVHEANLMMPCLTEVESIDLAP